MCRLSLRLDCCFLVLKYNLDIFYCISLGTVIESSFKKCL